jgi:hypothetical protein
VAEKFENVMLLKVTFAPLAKENFKFEIPLELIVKLPPFIVLLVTPGAPKAVLPEAAVMFVAKVIEAVVFL